jgi:phosphoglucosamine mutase
MKRLFGTDGIRGRARTFPLDAASMYALGESTAHRLIATGLSSTVLLGTDTRESGTEIARALSAGITAGGGRARFAGVIPTPGIAYLCRIEDAGAAISISASHNPWQDNGVKIFGHDGMKLSDELEKQIEDEMLQIRVEGREPGSDVSVVLEPMLVQEYEDFLVRGIGEGMLDGVRVVVDTGHGAAFEIGPRVFERAGAEVIAIYNEPDGRNINEGCGALHPEQMAEAVVQEKAAFGVSFDGDADRVIFADDSGKVRNGDEILFLLATFRKREGRLKRPVVVATVMSNLGFEKRLAEEEIDLVRASVGDKYVLERMIEHEASIGGEQSGHIIDLDVHTTGDGIHTALVMGGIIGRSDTPFSRMKTFDPMPQVLLNQKVTSKPPLESAETYQRVLADEKASLGDDVRILVRYSGTENLVRVMVEGPDALRISETAERLRDAIAKDAGIP